MELPQPKRATIRVIAGRILHITCTQEKDRQWLNENAKAYGQMFRELGKHEYSLHINDVWTPSEVIAYIARYIGAEVLEKE